MPEGKLIEAASELEGMYADIRKEKIFGIDLEFIPERSYFPLICLVQIVVSDRVYLIDPFKVKDLGALWQLVADQDIVTVLHAGSQDLAIIYQQSGFIPANIFDTQIAAGFCGLGFPAGYGKLVNGLFDQNLSKTESFTDWSLRPLSQSQVEYAIDDVLHLLPLYHRLIDLLKERGRLEWVQEELAEYQERSYYVKESGREFLRIKGAQGLSRRKLAVLQAICLWRDQEARRIDKPPRFIIGDNIILELAKKPPSQASDIQRIRGINQGQLSGWGKHVLRVTAEALALKDADCPQWPSGRAPSKADILMADLLYMVLKVRAQDVEIAPELLATRDDLQKLVRGDAPGLMHGWRHELVGKELIAVLDGAPLTVTVDKASDNPVSISIVE